jgi:hypothetical protein
MNGESRHLNSFDDWRKDDSFLTVLDVQEQASSHAIKRMFSKFMQCHEQKFRHILLDVTIARMKMEQPSIFWLGLDSMVMDNDDADERWGVEPTYKKVKGFHPLQLTWEGMIIDGQFRSGERSTHEFENTTAMLKRTIDAIRTRVNAKATIVVRLDAGYMDQKLLQFLDELNVFFFVGGRIYDNLKEHLEMLDPKAWDKYEKGIQVWHYTELGYRCKSWNKFYRAIYTQSQYDDKGRLVLDFARPDNLILTNIGMRDDLCTAENMNHLKEWMSAKKCVEAYHGRGAEELCHRGLKELGFEILPFKKYHPNMGVYHCMILAHALFEGFKRDVLFDRVVKGAYANTVRRTFIDIAGKIVKSGRRIILRVRQCVFARLNLAELWIRCCSPPVTI